MVISSPERLDYTFHALADPTRRAILERLSTSEATVTELREPFDISQPAVSKHLRVLERAGLVASRREGSFRHFRLVAEPIRDATQWLIRYRTFWEGRLDSLGVFLKKLEKQGNRKK